MDEEQFLEWVDLARVYQSADYSGFWDGYKRGLYRHMFEHKFGTDEEHATWMESANEKKNEYRRDRGLGYRAGFAGKDPRPIMKVRM